MSGQQYWDFILQSSLFFNESSLIIGYLSDFIPLTLENQSADFQPTIPWYIIPTTQECLPTINTELKYLLCLPSAVISLSLIFFPCTRAYLKDYKMAVLDPVFILVQFYIFYERSGWPVHFLLSSIFSLQIITYNQFNFIAQYKMKIKMSTGRFQI